MLHAGIGSHLGFARETQVSYYIIPNVVLTRSCLCKAAPIGSASGPLHINVARLSCGHSEVGGVEDGVTLIENDHS